MRILPVAAAAVLGAAFISVTVAVPAHAGSGPRDLACGYASHPGLHRMCRSCG